MAFNGVIAALKQREEEKEKNKQKILIQFVLNLSKFLKYGFGR